MNANLASEYVMQNSTNSIHVENQDDASENRWISHNCSSQGDEKKSISLSKQTNGNHFALLTNLQVQ